MRSGVLLLLASAHACEVTVWADDYFGPEVHGKYATFREGDYNYWKLIETMENDAVSSLTVEGHGCVAVLYGGPNFDDWQATFHEGRYALDAALAAGLRDNEVSSLRIGYGQAESNCRDNTGWVDQFGHGCKDYVKDGHCAGGHVLHEWVTESEFRFPHHNCCGCGGGISHTQGGCTPNCQDTYGWKDSFDHGCESYVNDGKCRDCEVRRRPRGSCQSACWRAVP